MGHDSRVPLHQTMRCVIVHSPPKKKSRENEVRSNTRTINYQQEKVVD